MINTSLKHKLDNLRRGLRSKDKVAIAFSGGVDSTFLAFIALDTLGFQNAIAVTALTDLIPQQEISEALSIAQDLGIQHMTIQLDLLSISEIASNPADRCYFCKNAIFSKIIDEASRNGISVILDGSNADDTSDYRPGMKALREMGVISPMVDAGLTKEDIRILSHKFGVKGAERPASPCLPTRIPYGTAITKTVLNQIEKAESYLRGLGINPVRVRVHGNIARIEALKEQFDNLMNNKETISSNLREIGFAYVALDLDGFISGSMNRAILEILEINDDN